MKNFMKEFKEFAFKGNVMDMAVGVIIGGAFSTIIKSLVENILMPLLSIVLGHVNVADLKVTVPNITGGANIDLAIGLFLQNVINFIFIALCVFILVKAVNRAKKPEEKKPAEPTKTEVLLTEIRDALKK
jgi:large conductance mechanosensitive channel